MQTGNGPLMELEPGELMVEEHGVSRFGLHRRHVIRYGQRVSDKAMEDILEKGASLAPLREIIAVVRYVEEGLGLHHLRIYWKENKEVTE